MAIRCPFYADERYCYDIALGHVSRLVDGQTEYGEVWECGVCGALAIWWEGEVQFLPFPLWEADEGDEST